MGTLSNPFEGDKSNLPAALGFWAMSSLDSNQSLGDDNADSSTANDDNEWDSSTQKQWEWDTAKKTEGSLPFHKHPRFRQVTKENADLKKELSSIEETLKEYWLAKKDLDLNELGVEWLVNLLKERLQPAQNEDSDSDTEEIQYALQEMKESWLEFDDAKLLAIAATVDWDLDRAYQIYTALWVNDLIKLTSKAQSRERKKAGESIAWGKSNLQTKSNRPVYVKWSGWLNALGRDLSNMHAQEILANFQQE